MTKTITYIGGMPSGTLEDPFTRQTWNFEQNKPIEVPEATATKLLSEQAAESPDWVAGKDQLKEKE